MINHNFKRKCGSLSSRSSRKYLSRYREKLLIKRGKSQTKCQILARNILITKEDFYRQSITLSMSLRMMEKPKHYFKPATITRKPFKPGMVSSIRTHHFQRSVIFRLMTRFKRCKKIRMKLMKQQQIWWQWNRTKIVSKILKSYLIVLFLVSLSVIHLTCKKMITIKKVQKC